MNKIITWVIGVVAILALVISIGNSVGGNQSVSLGGITNYDSLTLGEDLIVGGTSTFNGGTVTVTTSNTATSTVIAGCYQFYATSTATAQKFQASTTPGIMYSSYGSCPNL